MFVQRGADQVQDGRVQDSLQVQRVATRLHELVSRSGRIATDRKAVRTRGPGRVVLGSKPQLATAKLLVRWAGDSTHARSLRLQKNSCAGHHAYATTKNSSLFLGRLDVAWMARLRRG